MVLIDENETVGTAMRASLERDCDCPIELLRSPCEMDNGRYEVIFLNLSYHRNLGRVLEEIENVANRDFEQLVVFTDLCLYDKGVDLKDKRVELLCKKGVWIFGESQRVIVRELVPCGSECDGFEPDGTDPGELRKIQFENLSDREKEILALIGQGLSSKDIGERLCIAKKTVDHHRENIIKKLGLSGHLQLIAVAGYLLSSLLD